MLVNSFGRSTLFKLLALTFCISILSSCKSKQEEQVEKYTPTRGNQYSRTDDLSNCTSMKAVHILEDGNTVFSRMNENSWIAWSLDDKQIKARGINLNYFATSYDGRYQLSRISNGRYQLMMLLDGVYVRKSLLTLSSLSRPKMNFSSDSKFIIIRYRPFSSWGEDHIALFDIEKSRFQKTFKSKGIKFVETFKDEASILIGFDTGAEKYIVKYDLDSFKEIFRIDLPYYNGFSSLEVANDRIIAKSGNAYLVYSSIDGTNLYREEYKHIYEIEHQGRFALVARSWGEVAVVDLEDGSEVYSGKSPKEVVLSSCRLKTNPLRAVCRVLLQQNKIFIWGMENGENSLTCY